ncbi:DUF4124 domain-containing protein [Massilia endophytica]|uniref:DUF4124 domain-containing protein n=1 Tax=Massilia endophytica TaxID=2899220 RepID=UPI001E4A3961|nr:DUF4124 domain-containing protein [Massilia endophytica]UGQ45639.1 DUF4124 domain-containing protein [Massilia endophytica]
MLRRQSGISLVMVAVLMGGLAFLAMVAMMSMRHEKNYFAVGLDKVLGKSAAVATAVAPEAAAPAAEPLRKCVIDGRTVVSNVECGQRGRKIDIHESRGIESPKVPDTHPSEDAAAAMREKMIEKAAR